MFLFIYYLCISELAVSVNALLVIVESADNGDLFVEFRVIIRILIVAVEDEFYSLRTAGCSIADYDSEVFLTSGGSR